jgi:NAD+ kinase
LKQDGEHAETEVDGDGQDPPRDLVEELIGEEKDDEHTHRPDGTYEVLNEVVVDRGPNPSKSQQTPVSFSLSSFPPNHHAN